MSQDRDNFIEDVIITAAEGGVNYWGEVSDYEWCDASIGSSEPGLELKDNGTGWARFVLTEYDGGAQHVVDDKVVRHGISVIRDHGYDDDFPLSRSAVKDILAASAANDAGDIDADLADVIVQVGLFGQVIYG